MKIIGVYSTIRVKSSNPLWPSPFYPEHELSHYSDAAIEKMVGDDIKALKQSGHFSAVIGTDYNGHEVDLTKQFKA